MSLISNVLNSFFDISASRRAYKFFCRRVLRNPKIRHFEPSLIYSKEDANPSEKLIDLMAEALTIAVRTKLTCAKKGLSDSKFLNVFPGEHYRLLNAVVRATKSRNIVEIGTFTGMGTLALQDGVDDISVVTFDIIEWNKLSLPSHFDKSDLDGKKITQIIGDLSDDDFFNKKISILNAADIIFMDAPKDDNFEYKMAEKFSRLDSKKFKLLIIDDIQFVNMIDFWRAITSPKLDVTSFGHWSGTGIVDISDGFKFNVEMVVGR